MREITVPPELVANARILSVAADSRERGTFMAIHRLSVAAEIDGKVYDLILIVREAHNGTFHYDLTRDTDTGARFQTEPSRAGLEAQADSVGSNPGDLNIEIAAASGNLAALTADSLKKIMPRLREELDRLNLRDVTLKLDPSMTSQGRFEATRAGTMSILIGQSRDGMKTLRHEAIHALRAMGAFTAKEWAALEKAAQADWMQRYDIAARYPDYTREMHVEEAIAEAFAGWRAKTVDPKAPIIPACAGNRRVDRAPGWCPSVHPRVCGEQC